MVRTMFEVWCSKARIGVQVQLPRYKHYQGPFDVFCNFEKLGKCVSWKWFCKEFFMILEKDCQY